MGGERHNCSLSDFRRKDICQNFLHDIYRWGRSIVSFGTHGSLEGHEMLKRNDIYHSIADDVPIPKMYFFIKIGRWPFSKIAFLCPTRYFFYERGRRPSEFSLNMRIFSS